MTANSPARSFPPHAFIEVSDLSVPADLSRSHPVRHQTRQKDEVQDSVLPAGAVDALQEDVQGRNPLLQRHDLRGRRQGVRATSDRSEQTTSHTNTVRNWST